MFILTKKPENLLYQCTDKYTVPVLHPTEITVNADLIIQIKTPEMALAAVLPCHKQFMIDHVPLIEAKFREDSNWIKEEVGKIQTFDLCICGVKPQLVCDFFACFYQGHVNFTNENAAAFYWIARYLLCEEIRVKCEDFMKDNMCAEFLVDAWMLDVLFREPCMNFMKKINGEFRLTELKHVEKMDLSMFSDFIEQIQVPIKLDVYTDILHSCNPDCQKTQENILYAEYSDEDDDYYYTCPLKGKKTIRKSEVEHKVFDPNQFIKLKLKWLNENSSTDNYEKLIYETDFDELSDQEKFDFYRDVILEEIVDGKMIKKITEHVFKKKPVNLKANE